MSFFKKLKERMFRSSDKIGEGLEALVAEGAESPAHCTRLRELGCQVVQGYAIAHPMPGGEVADWARSYRRSVASTLVLP